MAERVAEVATDEEMTLVNGIVFRAVERAYTGALCMRCPGLPSRQDFAEMADHLRDEVLLAIRSSRGRALRRRGMKADG
jgi:hypothetical protein